MSNPFARSSVRWVPVVNIDAEPAPPFALLAPVGVDGQGRIEVTRPTQNSQAGLLVNGPGMIPPGVAGQATQTMPAIVAFDDGGDDAVLPLAPQSWGSIAPDGVRNAWKLQTGQSGFTIIGGAAYGRVMASATGAGLGLAQIKVTSLAPSTVYVGRAVKDATLAIGQNTFGSNSAGFTSDDDGSVLVGNGIPSGTTISSISSPQLALMSQNATVSGTNVTVTIGVASMKAYPATINNWIAPAGYVGNSPYTPWKFTGSTAQAWLLSHNSQDPSTAIPPHDQFPLGGTNDPLLCVLVGEDAAGTQIFVWPFAPGAFWDDIPTLFQTQFQQAAQPGIVQYGYPGAAARLSMGQMFALFGYMNDLGQAFGPNIYVAPPPSQVAPQAYAGDTGMNGEGDQFVSGLNVAIGGGATYVSGGSDW